MSLRAEIVRRLPPGIKSRLKYAVARLTSLGWACYCPVCEHSVRGFRPFGEPPRPEAQCPLCGALERHRLLWQFLRCETDLFDGRPKRVLHIAPYPHMARRIRELPGVDYLSADLESGDAMVQMDITDITYPDDSFDAVLCSHVLEHVPDDRRALRELRRVLARGGWAVLLVPIFGAETFEDSSVTDPAERLRLFGQSDHVRKYGADFEDRVREAGWRCAERSAREMMSPSELERMRIPASESLFYCTHEDTGS